MAVRSLVATLALCVFARAAPAPAVLEPRLGSGVDLVDYAPKSTSCPSTALVRKADSISSDEKNFVSSRKPKADQGLATWLRKQGNFSTASQPSVGFTSSGGGYRALLETAGVIQAIDCRDSSVGTSGIFQGLTYEAGLSGGSWFLSSLAGNNWPTVSSLRDSLWEQAFQASLLLPANILASDEYAKVAVDLTAKKAAGFDSTIVDPYARLLSYQLLHGEDGGANIRLSSLAGLSNFTSYNVPYPIITALGVDNSYSGQCYPTLNATQYEFTPYEYGSWDQGVAAFARSQYMGSSLTNGQPTTANKCIKDYDNLGYVFGTSSDIFASVCEAIEPANTGNASLAQVLESLVDKTKTPAFQDLFGIYPNPFYKHPESPEVNQHKLITMADGGLAGQNVPIWPFIQKAGRVVDVLIANDNSADTTDYFPNGTEIRQTYLNAQAAGLTRMPFVPEVSEFVAKGLNKRATFFGCNDTSKVFVIYLPNVNYTFMSNQPTSKIQYSVAETNAMIKNGNAIATQNGEQGWPFCFACGIKNRDAGALPGGCDACFTKYCYKR
ncbi:hypothetical protein DOTSEDRAFT_52875 [Dothistroma septosporum NZE10]|uniref:Lysophospholipase n=1 Tax=Dothistroma septosporum (strain NZE10 / CBS 128990) TaxID=675120 RepID=N1PQI9_DOTSN|nr:hypothetical protein DOTSEDRAFT_52875 [Dothistroma septosporum NZE10]